jgi:hypothetical protein
MKNKRALILVHLSTMKNLAKLHSYSRTFIIQKKNFSRGSADGVSTYPLAFCVNS